MTALRRANAAPTCAHLSDQSLLISLRMKNLKPEELLVFQHIKASDNMGMRRLLSARSLRATQLVLEADGCNTIAAGMWTKDLKFRTNLQQTQLTRVMRHPLRVHICVVRPRVRASNARPPK